MKTPLRQSLRKTSCLAAMLLALAGCEDVSGYDAAGNSDLQPIPVTFDLVQHMNVKPMPVAVAKPALKPDYDYVLGPGDVLDFRLWQNSGEVSVEDITPIVREQPVRIETDGTISLPNIQRIHIAGLTATQARAAINQRYKTLYREPQFELQVIEMHSKSFAVTGGVENPGPQYLGYAPTDIKMAMSAAGGPTEASDLHHAILKHADGTSEPIDLFLLLHEGDASQDRNFRPGDILVVPGSQHNKVFVMGEVGNAKAQFVKGGTLSLTEALNDAGGLNLMTASEGRIYVIRGALTGNEKPSPGGVFTAHVQLDKVTVYQLDTHNPAAFALADQFALEPRDIVYVSTSAITQWARFIDQLIPMTFSFGASSETSASTY